MSSTQNGQTFTVTNDPIKNVNPVEGAGDPYGVIGISVNTLTKPSVLTVASAQDAKNISTTSTKVSPAGASSRAKKKKTKTIASITHSDAKNNKNNQFIFGSEHNIHYGSGKSNHIKGRGGDDVIAGLDGNDKIYGGSGDDVLYGGSGKNHIYGGKGSDYVVFQKENVENGGMTIINDFNSNDKISISGYTPEEVSASKNLLILDGNTAGKFKGLDTNDIISMIEDAHYSA